MTGGAIPPAPAIPASTRISASLKLVGTTIYAGIGVIGAESRQRRVRYDARRGFFVENLYWVECGHPEDAMRVMQDGIQPRWNLDMKIYFLRYYIDPSILYDLNCMINQREIPVYLRCARVSMVSLQTSHDLRTGHVHPRDQEQDHGAAPAEPRLLALALYLAGGGGAHHVGRGSGLAVLHLYSCRIGFTHTRFEGCLHPCVLIRQLLVHTENPVALNT